MLSETASSKATRRSSTSVLMPAESMKETRLRSSTSSLPAARAATRSNCSKSVVHVALSSSPLTWISLCVADSVVSILKSVVHTRRQVIPQRNFFRRLNGHLIGVTLQRR